MARIDLVASHMTFLGLPYLLHHQALLLCFHSVSPFFIYVMAIIPHFLLQVDHTVLNLFYLYIQWVFHTHGIPSWIHWHHLQNGPPCCSNIFYHWVASPFPQDINHSAINSFSSPPNLHYPPFLQTHCIKVLQTLLTLSGSRRKKLRLFDSVIHNAYKIEEFVVLKISTINVLNVMKIWSYLYFQLLLHPWAIQLDISQGHGMVWPGSWWEKFLE